MFQAQMLHATGTGVQETETHVLSPWFPRGGDNIIYAADLVTQSTSNGVLKVSLLTKNSEDTGDGAAVSGSDLDVSTESVAIKQVNGQMKELVRFKFEVDKKAASTDWIMFRVLQPSWFDDVDA